MAIWPALILSEQLTGKEWVMTGDRTDPYRIGRSSSCDFKVTDKALCGSVSSLHAAIHFDADMSQWVVTDLGSKSGTFVTKVSQSYRRCLGHGESECLDHGDTLRLGGPQKGVEFVVQCLEWNVRHLVESVRRIEPLPGQLAAG
eukprot:CAMPEP_0113665652 /NCGR_PEP_ID=MMETSP0038_2-20120614/2423_1 /TAXON_ID=2898 /ORGANISM="Cryptomonas paramecium" /LENGTH=143 /DNA_ID=CAMNT_0000581027 /DNA_START=25 /DNA_END=452 /DNA_ORIENTATION=+ /assembly_acc=CAM_ASM_000170